MLENTPSSEPGYPPPRAGRTPMSSALKDSAGGRHEGGRVPGALRAGERGVADLEQVDRVQLRLEAGGMQRVGCARVGCAGLARAAGRPAPRARWRGGRRQTEIAVRIDEPGIDGEAGAIDDLRVGGRGDRGADGFDQPMTYDDGASRDRRAGDGHDAGVRDRVHVGNVAFALHANLRLRGYRHRHAGAERKDASGKRATDLHCG